MVNVTPRDTQCFLRKKKIKNSQRSERIKLTATRWAHCAKLSCIGPLFLQPFFFKFPFYPFQQILLSTMYYIFFFYPFTDSCSHWSCIVILLSSIVTTAKITPITRNGPFTSSNSLYLAVFTFPVTHYFSTLQFFIFPIHHQLSFSIYTFFFYYCHIFILSLAPFFCLFGFLFQLFHA